MERLMGISKLEQDMMQATIETATKEELQIFEQEAKSLLNQASAVMSQKVLTREEMYSVHQATEMLVRIEATSKNKGSLFRLKRRVQIAKMYLG